MVITTTKHQDRGCLITLPVAYDVSQYIVDKHLCTSKDLDTLNIGTLMIQLPMPQFWGHRFKSSCIRHNDWYPYVFLIFFTSLLLLKTLAEFRITYFCHTVWIYTAENRVTICPYFPERIYWPGFLYWLKCQGLFSCFYTCWR